MARAPRRRGLRLDRRRQAVLPRPLRPPRPRARTPRLPPAPARGRPPTGPHGWESRSTPIGAAPIPAAGARSSGSCPGPAAGAVADGAEFVAGAPVRPVGRVRQLAADAVEDAQLLEGARPVPLGI